LVRKISLEKLRFEKNKYGFKIKLMKFVQKIFRVCLVIFLMCPVLIGIPLEVEAIDEVIVMVGNHNEGGYTNMMVQFKLNSNWVAGEDFVLTFDAGVGLTNLDNNLSFTIEHDDDDDNNESPTENGTVEQSIGVGTAINQATVVVSGQNITIAAHDTTFAQVDSGRYVRILIGPKEGMDLYNGGVSGDGVDIITGFNGTSNFVGTAGNALNDGGVDPIIMPTNVSESDVLVTKDNGVWQVGAFAVIDNAASYDSFEFKASVEPYITLELFDSALEFGEMTDAAISGDIATMVVQTNAKTGYTLRYRATEFSNGTYDFLRASNAALTAGKWGINLANNTAASIDIGVLPINSSGNPYANNTLGTGSLGVDYGIMDGYEDYDVYDLGAVNSLEPIIINNGASKNSIILSAAVWPAADAELAVYSGSVTMNIYANF